MTGKAIERKSLRILLVEDSRDDAEFLKLHLEQAGFDLTLTRVENAPEMSAALSNSEWDAILSDYTLPHFSAPLALALLHRSECDLPFIVVTGTIGEEAAVSLMKAGAHDFVLKNNLRRLVPAIERELRDAATRKAMHLAAEERDNLFKELRAALHSRDEFLSIASHELKTPLTPLKLQVQSVKRLLAASPDHWNDILKRKILKMIETSEQEVDRLAELIDSLLDVSRIRTGQLLLKPVRLDLSNLICNVVDQYAEQIREAGCPLEIDIEEGIEGFIDRFRIEEVFINLITNAVRYARGKTIRVNARSDGKIARIIIEDQGPGIQLEDQQRIFMRFEQIPNKNHLGGLGLGLYISKQILAAHGGSIRLESAPERGAKFIVELPLDLGNTMKLPLAY